MLPLTRCRFIFCILGGGWFRRADLAQPPNDARARVRQNDPHRVPVVHERMTFVPDMLVTSPCVPDILGPRPLSLDG